MSRASLFSLLSALALGLVSLSGCSDSNTKYVNLGTAPPAGSFNPIGTAMAATLNAHAPASMSWQAIAKTTQGSQENIRLLSRNELDIALSNSSISYFAARKERGWEEAYKIRSVMTLVPNVAMFIAKEEKGINTMADLKGRKVVIGPQGAGFDQFVAPILEEHGMSLNDLDVKYMPQNEAMSALGDGTVDAAFLGGSIPTTSITQACTEMNVHFIPYDDAARQKLIEKYSFFEDYRDLTSADYSDIKEPLHALNVGSMHLITSDTADEETIYQITKTLYENMEDLRKAHASLRELTDDMLVRNTGLEFHPGAIRFYKEKGIWKEPAGN